MSSAFDTYRTYLALKQHFSNGSYDYFKYNGRVGAKQETFNGRKDRFFFEKLSRKFGGNRDKIQDFLVANFIQDENLWIREILGKEGDERYATWRSREESASYIFQQDAEKIRDAFDGKFNDLFHCDGDYPPLLSFYMEGLICLESLIRFDHAVGCFRRWNKEIHDPVIWPDLFVKMERYRPFLNLDRSKLCAILRKTFSE